MVALVQQPAPGATEIALEQALAERLGLEVGDTVRLGAAPDSLPRLAVVAAIYEPRPDPAELSRQGRRMRMHLPDLAALLDAPDRVDRFGIGLVPGVNADSAAAVLNRRGSDTAPTSAREAFALLTRAVADYAGLDYKVLASGGRVLAPGEETAAQEARA